VTGESALAEVQCATHATAFPQPNPRLQPRHGAAKRFALDGAVSWTANAAEKQAAAVAPASIRTSVRALAPTAVDAINATTVRSNANRRSIK
jgi:hypothetical protein